MHKNENKSENVDTIIIDSTTIKTDNFFQVSGIDGNKKIKGIKIHLATDSYFTIIDSIITSANIYDGVAGIELIDSVLKKP